MTAVDEKRRARPATYDHLKKKKPLETTVEIFLEDEAIEAVAEARRQYYEAQAALEKAPDDSKLKKAVDQASKAVDEAIKAQDADCVELRFRTCGRKKYEALIDKYPPTDEQVAKAKEIGETAGWDADAFPVALIAECCIEPKMTYEQVEELFDEWNVSEVQALFFAALRVNTSQRIRQLGNVSGGMLS